MITRRNFITGVASAVALSPADSIAAAPAVPASIDVHHHALPPFYLEPMRDYVARGQPAMRDAMAIDWSPARSLEEMDANGVATAILSISSPGVWFGDAAAAGRLASECNNYMAGLRRDHPGRFGHFAALPLPDIDASLAEIERVYSELDVDGIGLMTSYDDRWLGDSRFAAVFAELDRRRAVVFVHPTVAPCCANLQPELQPAFLEFPFDSTRTIASLLLSGTLSRHPDIRFVFSHGGGALPAIHSRLMAAAARSEVAEQLPYGPMVELRKPYYDIASVSNRPSFAALSALIPMSNLLLGTDYPFMPGMGITVNELGTLGLLPQELSSILRDNARNLMPQLATAA